MDSGSRCPHVRHGCSIGPLDGVWRPHRTAGPARAGAWASAPAPHCDRGCGGFGRPGLCQRCLRTCGTSPCAAPTASTVNRCRPAGSVCERSVQGKGGRTATRESVPIANRSCVLTIPNGPRIRLTTSRIYWGSREGGKSNRPERPELPSDLAEREGFEPSVLRCSTPDFESGAFDHSATFPGCAAKVAILADQGRNASRPPR